MKNYTTKEVAELLGVSERTIQRHIATLIETLKTPNNKGFTIPEDIANLLLSRHQNDKTTTESDTENSEFPYVEYFTEEEYEEFKKRITEYPFLKEQISISQEYLESLKSQIEYFRMSYHRQLDIHEKLIDSVKERNFIEAKEKGLDNP
ncbi:DNA binding domain-containing protein, excisionase family [Chryseobacterium shigense]|uniref:DNA binding domain-containing protein, excisionase family n=1 Tax=Chryseobacterium shigense TaxID=297244 RepID=A0A1N7KKB0_9FLAO|nr:helix-turn-helix domain-containing protein [Chryseobacterium shigense]SIS62052.1 DNA binding domain-containing protein, excisionase family [Chryseobacterium shigense]